MRRKERERTEKRKGKDEGGETGKERRVTYTEA